MTTASFNISYSKPIHFGEFEIMFTTCKVNGVVDSDSSIEIRHITQFRLIEGSLFQEPIQQLEQQFLSFLYNKINDEQPTFSNVRYDTYDRITKIIFNFSRKIPQKEIVSIIREYYLMWTISTK